MATTVPDAQTLKQLLRRGVAEIIVEEEFINLLKSGRPLRLKQGFDPSRPDLTLGHAVGLRKLRQLQELGHTVVLIVGDWTAQIGDPTGRSATRPALSKEEVAENAKTYLEQFFMVVDKSKTEVRRQTEWFDGFSLADVIHLTRRFTVAQLLKRDDFAKRYEENAPIAVMEFLYPLLQAYDSVMVKADVEFGGTDQRFNNLLGRELQAQMGQRPQQVFLVPLLVGTDGVQKMSKSLGNYIGIAEASAHMYGKCMSIPDKLLGNYFELLTDVPDAELAEINKSLPHSDGETQRGPASNPMELKKRLARLIVAQFHDAAAAQAGEEFFERVVQRKERPEEIPTLALPFSGARGENADLLVDGGVHIVRLIVRAGLATSAGEARRLLQQGAVKLDGRKLAAEELVAKAEAGATLQVGNRRYVQLVDVP